MISVSEAKSIVRNNTESLVPVKVQLQKAAGLVLAEDIYAAVDIPAFNQSSMDGYAFAFNHLVTGQKLPIAGEVPAGVNVSFENLAGKAVRIFTGAPVPTNADTVVMQEKTAVENGHVIIQDDQLTKGTNVRPKGSEIKAGALGL